MTPREAYEKACADLKKADDIRKDTGKDVPNFSELWDNLQQALRNYPMMREK